MIKIKEAIGYTDDRQVFSDEQKTRDLLKEMFIFLSKHGVDQPNRKNYDAYSKLYNIKLCCDEGLKVIRTHSQLIIGESRVRGCSGKPIEGEATQVALINKSAYDALVRYRKSLDSRPVFTAAVIRSDFMITEDFPKSMCLLY